MDNSGKRQKCADYLSVIQGGDKDLQVERSPRSIDLR